MYNFKFENHQVWCKSVNNFDISRGYYDYNKNLELGFCQSLEKIKYIFSTSVEKRILDVFYKHLNVTKYSFSDNNVNTHYDSKFINPKNNLESISEVKFLTATSKDKKYGKAEYASVLLLESKLKSLLQLQNKYHNIMYVCYLEEDNSIIYHDIKKIWNSKYKDIIYNNDRLKAPFINTKQIDSNSAKYQKKSYLLDINKDFAVIENVNLNIYLEDILEEEGLQFLLHDDCRFLLYDIVKSCKLSLRTNLLNIKNHKELDGSVLVSKDKLKLFYESNRKR